MESGLTRQKNACSNGPAIIVCCYLYQILGDSSYLTKAQQIYTWEHDHLFNTATGAVADNQQVSNGSVNTAWVFSYNLGTFIGGANALYNITGTRSYYQDALLTMRYSKNTLCGSNGIFPASSDDGGDGGAFNGIGFRWMARFVADQHLWGDFYPWLKANADAAWNVRRTSDNLSWCNWNATTAAGTRYATGCFGSVTALQVVPPSDPTPAFILVNKNTGTTADLIGGNTANDASIDQYAYDYNNANQRFALVPNEAGTHFKLVSLVSRRTMRVSGNSTADGASIVSSDYVATNSAEQWDLIDAGNGWFKIKNVNSGKLLEISTQPKLQQWGDDSTAAQLWRLQPQGDYYLRSANSGRYVCVKDNGSTNTSPIVQHDKLATAAYQWRWQTVGDGNYKVASLNALTRVISVINGSTSGATNTQLYDYNVNNAGDQKVRIQPLLDGHFKFHFVHDGMSWDFLAGNKGNDVPLEQFSDTNNLWQRFDFERAP